MGFLLVEDKSDVKYRQMCSEHGPISLPCLNQRQTPLSAMLATATNPLRVGLRQERVIAPQCLVIFGASGDLTHRKLVPALFELFRQRRLPSEFAVLGCARRPWSDEVFREKMSEALAQRIEEDPQAWDQFVGKLFYEPVDLQQPDHVVRLGERLERIDEECSTHSNRTFYLSVSPKFYGSGCRALADAGLLKDPQRSRVVIEKPFGRDYGSAQTLNRVVQSCGQENQIFRIDHYLGKETVQNIMVLRFANTIFEPIWNRNYISSVQITAAETVGVEERAGYYETSGALRDMVQNHLTQMLAITAMETPGRFDPEAIRSEKAKVLQAARLADENEPWNCCIRGQYGPGGTHNAPLPGYRQEHGVAPDSTVETFVALKMFIDSWRWDGVPFFIRAGKGLAKTATEVTVELKRPPLGNLANPAENFIRFQLSPELKIVLGANVKKPGEAMKTTPTELSLIHQSEADRCGPYERLLGDAMKGDFTLFARQDAVEAAWEVVEPILNDATPIHSYDMGTWGPAQADALTQDVGGWAVS